MTLKIEVPCLISPNSHVNETVVNSKALNMLLFVHRSYSHPHCVRGSRVLFWFLGRVIFVLSSFAIISLRKTALLY